VALVRVQQKLSKLETRDEDEQIGVGIVVRALEEPLRRIAENAGAEGSIVVERVRSGKEAGFGYNAQTDKYEDLVEAGVIDPTKVTRTALQNAASIAGLLLTTECVVVEKPEENKTPPMPGGGGMGGMY
jgi:chaperonin GroEL